MIVRSARADDVPALQAIERDAARTYAILPATAFCVTLPARDDAEHARARTTGTTLVVEDDDGLVGFVLGVPVDGRAHLLELAVRQSHQRRGHGRRLLDAFEGWARKAGFEEVSLTTFRDVPWNDPFYARMGYITVDPGVDHPGLCRVVADETAAGFDGAPRVAMVKRL